MIMIHEFFISWNNLSTCAFRTLTVIFSDDTRTPHSILVLFRTNFPSEKKALQDKYVYK